MNLIFLEIPIAVTVKWDDKNAIDILCKKVEEVSYPLGEDDRYTDESKAKFRRRTSHEPNRM